MAGNHVNLNGLASFTPAASAAAPATVSALIRGGGKGPRALAPGSGGVGGEFGSSNGESSTASASISSTITTPMSGVNTDGTANSNLPDNTADDVGTGGISKKRKAVPGSRGVANLTPEQLAKKRANGKWSLF